MDTTSTILALCFWCSAAGVFYAYAGYPIVISVLSRLFGTSPTPPPESPGSPTTSTPRVALLIAAHNEAAVIEQRIRNALACDYPADHLQVVIASDGSDDGTDEICRRYQEHGVRLLAFPRSGKPATLNAAIPQIDAEIIALSDANTGMDPGAVRRLARWFTDPRVGAVCGRLILTDPVTGLNADGLYWRYETFLKRCEARLNGLLGANGAIYAIRRELFSPLPPGTVVDDFVVPLAAKIHSGCRIVYEPAAIATEETAPDLRGEFRRRTRIGAGGFHALTTLSPLLSPRYGWTAFTFWSHKVLRWICPILLITALATAGALAGHPLYRAALIAQGVFYALCVLGAVLPASTSPTAQRGTRLLRLLPMFAGMNLALLTGLTQWLRGRHTGIWNPTARAQD